jgi:uncharacterized lipoprotein YajG
MKRLLLVVTMLSAGAIFAGCQQAAPSTTKAPETTAPTKQETSAKTTTTTPTSDADEVKMIDNDLKQLDATKDFPDFSQSDLQ